MATMATNYIARTRKEFEKELVALSARCDAIRDVIASLDRLDAATTGGKRSPRSSRAASVSKAKGPAQRDQVLTLMATDPTHPWTLDELVVNTTIPNKNCARGVITRLRASGLVESFINGGFKLTPTRSEGTQHHLT